ncbi:uncharacterized protein si:ch211-13c6.2 isoform X1 [Lates calcarifer]|uniref:Uncharacterized protein si:ch211-13c6.2 isoform X1 n=2 Tax=Lates calcarifer TaxID=8187 RepID=A0AAJ7QDJ4_LATCA|nr:uncharacterized protein si:ch211-13c6.2 isoform X1 [Lates calcarifer]
MDSLETPYDDETEFIKCPVCDKSIRGETWYKIHLTTPGHIKKEDGMVAAGQAVRKHIVPEFKDILQYLDYLKIDEPIIGLSYLEEVPGTDSRPGPRYSCRLCHLAANLPEMVHHVIGRKHRQKYMEVKRPDLVTWDKQSIITQGGKIIRARAEIIERQDGRGNPLPMPNRGVQVPPRQRQNRDRNITQRDVPSLLPELNDYQDEYSRRGGYPPVYSDTPLFHPDEPYMNRDSQVYQREDSLSRDHMEEELYQADLRENNTYRQEQKDPNYRREYGEEPQRKAMLEPGGVNRYDQREEMPMPHSQTQHVEYYPEEAPPYRKPYPERDALKEFYSEEVRRGRVRSADYQPSQPIYAEDKHQWSLDRESGRHDSMNRAGRQGSSEPEAKRRSFPTPVEDDRAHDHLFNIIKDYQHKPREPHQELAVSNPGPSRAGPPSSQRRVEVTRTMSDIPEPFRRFLTGATNNDRLGKRKRKSRFSDATAEEVEMTKEMFSDEYGPPDLKFGGRPRPVSVPLRPDIHRSQHPDVYTESQVTHHTESYQRGDSGSEGVFDMLKSIEIENAEEADFLKNKLCSLLREFKAKKSEKAVQNSQVRAVLNNDYNSLKPDQHLSPRHQYERTLREDSDLRRPQDSSYKDDHRGRGWKQHEYIPDKRFQEYHSPARGEPGHSNRSRYEEFFESSKMSRTLHATHPDESVHYPERFQEPMHPHDYRPAAEEYFDSHSSSPSLHMEQETRMHRGPRYSKNLDKITSTLLELVARK